MKKKFLMLGMALMVLASCTQNEVLDVPESRMIQFDSFVEKNTRVAIPINQQQDNNMYEGDTPPKSNLYQFWVFGIENKSVNGDIEETVKFDATDDKAKVYFHKENNSFSYDKPLSWVFDRTYNFAAYSNGNCPLIDGADYSTEVSNPLTNVKFSNLEAAGNVYGSQLFFEDYKVGDLDLLAAIAKTEYLSPTLTNPTPVGLTFQHMLSLVNITLTNGTSDVYMQIQDIEFEGIVQDDCLFMINRENTETTKSKREVIWENIDGQLLINRG